jgi:hypothetical protein
MNSNDLKHNKNLKPNKTLLAIIFSLIFTMFFLSFQCNLFGGGGSGGIFIPPPPGGGGGGGGSGGGPSLSNPALSIDNTKRSYSSILDSNYYYLLSKHDNSDSKLIIHKISSNFFSISSKSFAFISSSVQPVFPTNILDNSSELIISADIHNLNVGTQYDSAILKINKDDLSSLTKLFFPHTIRPLILFDDSNNYIYLSLVTDSFPSQGYLLILDTNFNILQQYKTDTESISGYPPNIYLSSQTNSNLCLTGGAQDRSSNILNPGVIIISKSNLTTASNLITATKIPFNYSYPNTHYITSQNPLITTESDTDYVYFADAIDSHTFYINKISVPTIASGAIASASTKISLPSSSIIHNININKINNQIVVGISKTESSISSINKLLFIILNPSDLNRNSSFELYVNNNQLFMYHYQKYHQTPDNGFILTGNLNPPSYKIFFLKFNNLFNLTENNIFKVVDNPTVDITSSSYTLPTIDTIKLSPSSLTHSTTLYTVQPYPWTSNLSTNP